MTKREAKKLLPSVSDEEIQFANKLAKNIEKVDKKIKKYKKKYKIRNLKGMEE